MIARPSLLVGARALIDYMSVREGESVLFTADECTDTQLLDAAMAATIEAGARPTVLKAPQLPFQGGLADPYISDVQVAAMQASDVWIDFAFPYFAGSHAHDQAMKARRCRYLLAGDLGAEGVRRLFGSVDLDHYYRAQGAFDRVFLDAVGKTCRITTPSGTDVSFALAKSAFVKPRRVVEPGMYLVPGSCSIHPDVDTVSGCIVVTRGFHERYEIFDSPITLLVQGRIRSMQGGGASRPPLQRAMLRAGGGHDYGSIIHFTHGFHPAAVLTGKSFIEDQRAVGCNAVGLGIPWWLPGGGENHPDVVLTEHSVWIENHQIIADGLIIGPPELIEAVGALAPGFPPNLHQSATLTAPTSGERAS